MTDVAKWLSDFGGAPGSDCSSALNAFGTLARTYEGQDAHIWLYVDPGTYEFVLATAFTALEGISELTITGTGASFQNTTTSSGPWIVDCFPNLHPNSGGVAELIDSVVAGASSVTLKTPANAASFAVGNAAVVMSEDIQISSSNFSYPPNCNLFDYVEVTSVDSSTGAITFTPPLGHSHSEDNIDGPTSNTHLCGKARIWLLDTESTSPTKWDISHTYKNLTILESPSPSQDYIGMAGRYVEWNGCTIPGISPTQAGEVRVIDTTINGSLSAANEPDKLVGTLLLDGVTSEQQLTFQSSSIDSVTISNSSIGVFLGSGTPKVILIDNCTSPIYSEGIAGTKYGHNLSTTIRDCVFDAWASYVFVVGAANTVTIDGVDITYASGIITVPKDTADLASWNVVPNVTSLNLATTASNYFTGDVGTALVTSLTEDATNIYYHVSGWPASLPAYASGDVYISRSGLLYCYNVTGCDEAVSATVATAAGKFPWQLYTKTYVEADGNSGSFGSLVGDFLSIEVTVTNPSATAGNLWQFATNLVDATTMAGSQQLLVNIDITIAGTRTFTQSSLTGKVGNDDVLLGGVSQSTLPSGKWAQTVPSWAYASGLPSNPSTLSIAVSAEFDPGGDFRRDLIMADAAVAITAGTGTNIDTRTESTNGNHRQVVVLGDPSTNAGVAAVDATAGLKVDLGADNDVTVSGTVASTQSGTWNVGTVTTVTNVVHVDDNSSTLSVDDGAGSLTVDGTVAATQSGTWNVGTVTAVTAISNALPAGTNAIGKLAANSGVDIGDVDVTSVIAGTGATNLGKAEDAAHSSGDTGVMALAVRKDTSSTGIGADGDYAPVAVNSTGHVYVAIDSTQLGSLGQTTASASAPVVLASDRQNSVIFPVSMTTDTGAYASADLIADTQQLNGFFNKTDGKGVIDSVTIFDAEDNTASAYYVLFHQTSTSMGTENSAPSISDANAAAGILGFVPIASTDWLDIGNSKVATVRNVGLRVSAVSGTDDLYVSIVNGAGTPTFTGGVVKMVIGGFLD